MSRLFCAALGGAVLLAAAGCSSKDSGVIAPTDTKPAPKVMSAGGGSPAPAKKPSIPSKGAE